MADERALRVAEQNQNRLRGLEILVVWGARLVLAKATAGTGRPLPFSAPPLNGYAPTPLFALTLLLRLVVRGALNMGRTSRFR